MNSRKVQVITGPESTGVCQLVRKMVVRQGGVQAGKAGDSSKPMTLVMDLDQDVAIIDCSAFSDNRLKDLPVSGLGGMDIARMITQEMPGTEVVLLNNQALALSGAVALPGYGIPSYRGPERTGNIYETREVESTREALPAGRTNPFDIIMFCGACGVALGWFLLIAMISFTGGGIVAIAGAFTIVVGLVGKQMMSLWQRLHKANSEAL